MTPPHPAQHHAVPPWRDERVLGIATQLAVVLGVALLVAFLARNLLGAMSERGMTLGLGFLDATAGFEISETPFDYRPTDSYGRAFQAGLLNTIFVSVAGIVLATLLGLFVGVARLSSNWLVRQIAGVYVEVMRNTPLLVQLFLLYFAVLLQLPAVSEAIALPGSVYLSQRGLFLPAPTPSPTLPTWLALVALAVVVALVARSVARRREALGRPVPRLRTVAVLVGLAIVGVGWLALERRPILLDLPVPQRFNFTGGMALSPEFSALLVGLVLYTAAFIGEIVRGGILAVRRGQLEAARALGLSEGQTLRLVVLPQALRVIVPPMTSQYLNLAKNSSLAIAIGYPDLFNVSATIASQTGQPVSVIALVMGTYLAISLVTSALLNAYNRRVQVMER